MSAVSCAAEDLHAATSPVTLSDDILRMIRQRAWCLQAAEVIQRAVRRWRTRRRLSTALAFRRHVPPLFVVYDRQSRGSLHAHAVVDQWRPECRHWILPEVQDIVDVD